MIAGFAKNFGIPLREVLDHTWMDVALYSASLPSYEMDGKESEGKDDEVIDGDDPKNQQKLREIIYES